MDVNQGVESNNRRIAVLKRWLAKPPTRAKAVQLVERENKMPLGEWPIDDIVPGLAHEIEALAAEHAESDDAPAETRFVLSFVNGDGAPILVKPFSIRKPKDVLEGRDIFDELDGSERAGLRQGQRFSEAMVRMNLTTQQAQVKSLLEINSNLSELVTSMSQRLMDSEQRADEAREGMQALRNAMIDMMTPEEGKEAVMTPAQERAMAIFERYLPVLLMKLGAGSMGGATPPAAAA